MDRFRRNTISGEKFNLLREISMTIRDRDNMVARALRARFKKDEFDALFFSLKPFPPKGWR
jgi:hypothetical protein